MLLGLLLLEEGRWVHGCCGQNCLSSVRAAARIRGRASGHGIVGLLQSEAEHSCGGQQQIAGGIQISVEIRTSEASSAASG